MYLLCSSEALGEAVVWGAVALMKGFLGFFGTGGGGPLTLALLSRSVSSSDRGVWASCSACVFIGNE